MNFSDRLIPLLASPQGGVAASSKKFREATEADAAGWFSFSVSIGKPPRPRNQRRLRGILLIARPPLLAVMQGGEYARFQIHSHSWYSATTVSSCLNQSILSFLSNS